MSETIHKAKGLESEFVILRNQEAQRPDLTYETLGLYTYLMSLPQDWEIRVANLQREGAGRDKVQRMIKELVAKGYVTLIHDRNEKGQTVGSHYEAYAYPELNPHRQPEKPLTGKAVTGLPLTGEPQQQRKKKITKPIEDKENKTKPFVFARLTYDKQLYDDGKRFNPMEFQIEYNTLFYAWLEALEAASMPRGNDYPALWERERDGAVALAKQRIKPDELKRYVSEDLLADKKGGNWYRVNAKIPKLETVATHIGAWLKEQNDTIQTESSDDEPALALKPKFTREQMRKALGLESKDE